MINNLIKAYISTKHLFLKEPKDYFEKFIENNYFDIKESIINDQNNIDGDN